MKILILSCNTGQGHNSAGKAILGELMSRGIECEFRDALAFASPTVSRRISNAYITISTKAPDVFHAMYAVGGKISNTRIKSPVYLVNRIYKNKIADYIDAGGFDAVVMPHLFPAQSLTSLRHDGRLSAKTFAVATDYTCIPFWEETECDYYVTPHTELNAEFVAHGVPAEKLLPFGIPVNTRLGTAEDKTLAKKHLGFDVLRRAALVMTGSMGFGSPQDIADALLTEYGDSIDIVILGGNNEKLKTKLRRRFTENRNVYVVDFTDNVPLYMDACDVLFTKPGGLTSTEGAAKNIPMVLTPPIPGCETRNLAFFTERGCAVTGKTPAELAAQSRILLSDEAKRSAMLAAQRKYIDPFAAVKICDFILSH